MPLIVIFIIWYVLIGRNNPKLYNAIGDKVPKIIALLFLVNIAMSWIPSLLFGSIITAITLAFTIGPIVLFVWLILKLTGKGRKLDRKSDYKYYQSTYGRENKTTGRGMTVTGLTRSVPKRRKIVARFNKKYKLTLTDTEIDRIVDASYMSNCWEKEIYDMNSEYDTIHQWYVGETGWFRAYIRVFAVQSISSNFEMQRKICLDSFDEIFRSLDMADFSTIDECVTRINNRYMSEFDESTFMIAYRFLEANGRKYELPHAGIVRNDSEIESLMDKYDNIPKSGDTGVRTVS